MDGVASSEMPSRLLGVVLVYEDLATGLRARQAFDHLVDQLELEADFRLNLWNFGLLRDPAHRQEAAREASDADIIVLSAHGQGELPAQVKAWLREWLELNADRPTALVASLDESVKDQSSENRILAHLRSLAAEAGAELILHFGPPARPETDLTVESIRERVETSSALLEEILHRHAPYPRWGINE